MIANSSNCLISPGWLASSAEGDSIINATLRYLPRIAKELQVSRLNVLSLAPTREEYSLLKSANINRQVCSSCSTCKCTSCHLCHPWGRTCYPYMYSHTTRDLSDRMQSPSCPPFMCILIWRIASLQNVGPYMTQNGSLLRPGVHYINPTQPLSHVAVL